MRSVHACECVCCVYTGRDGGESVKTIPKETIKKPSRVRGLAFKGGGKGNEKEAVDSRDPGQIKKQLFLQAPTSGWEHSEEVALGPELGFALSEPRNSFMGQRQMHIASSHPSAWTS